MLCRAPYGSVVKRSNHGKHGHTPTKAQNAEPERLRRGLLFHSSVVERNVI